MMIIIIMTTTNVKLADSGSVFTINNLTSTSTSLGINEKKIKT